MNERLLVVHNPHSTRSARVAKNVLGRLDDAGVAYDSFIPQSADFEDNTDDICTKLEEVEPQTVLSAAGDGTGAQVANAVSRNGPRGILLGFLGYGNFNDLAGKERDPLELLSPSAQPSNLYPLTINVNGEYWREAPAYATLGFTAVAASQFGNTSSRETMKRMPEAFKAATSMGQLGVSYFKHNDKKLPSFTRGESDIVQKELTDILLLNSPQAGRIIKSRKNYGELGVFGYHEADVSKIVPNIPFGVQALFGRAPAEQVERLQLNFEETSDIPIQTEGEFALLHGVSSLSVDKDMGNPLQVLRSSSWQ